MKFFAYLLLFFFFIAVQSSFPFGMYTPDLPFLFFFCMVTLMDELEGLSIAMLFGFIMDAVTGILFGYHILLYSFTAYLMTSLRNRQLLCQKYELSIILMVISVLAGMSQIYLIGALAAPLGQADTLTMHSILLRVFLDALLSVIAFGLLYQPLILLNHWFLSLYERRNSRRRRRWTPHGDDQW